MSITRQQVMPLLMEVAPGFEERWRKHIEWWGDQERGDFNDVAEFAHYLVDSFAVGRASELSAVFETIERILEQGDASAKELAIVGVLEDIQTISSHRPFGPQAFEPWLGRLSRKAWEEIDRLWRAAGGSFTGVVRREKQSGSK